MLNAAPRAINSMTRNVVVNHPNTFNCKVFREVVERVEPPGIGGRSAMGGMGVLDTEDEERVRHEFLGNGFALPAEGFAPSPIMGARDAAYGAEAEFRFLIEPEEPSGHAEHFDVRKHDVFYLILGEGSPPPMIAFEVVNTETTTNIPPFTVRYVCNRRDDLGVPAGP